MAAYVTTSGEYQIHLYTWFICNSILLGLQLTGAVSASSCLGGPTSAAASDTWIGLMNQCLIVIFFQCLLISDMTQKPLVLMLMSNINYTLTTAIFKESTLLEHPFPSNTGSDRLCYITGYAVRVKYDFVTGLPPWNWWTYLFRGWSSRHGRNFVQMVGIPGVALSLVPLIVL